MDILLTKDNDSSQLARVICLLFHPLFLGLFVLFVTDYLASNSISHALYWSTIVAVFTCVMGLFYIRQLAQNKMSDFGNIASIRSRLYAVGFVLAMVIFSLFYWLSAPVSLIVCTVAGIVLVALATVANQFVQIPVSALACGASFATALTTPFLWLSILLFLVMVITAWARYEVNKHTWQSILTAWALSIPTTYFIITSLISYFS